MKKIKIYRQIKVGGKRYKEAIECEKLNEYLAIYKDKDKATNGVIIDIETGLAVAFGKYKKDVIDTFNFIFSKKYYDYIQTKEYKEEVKKFNELEEYHQEIAFDDTESELDNED